MLSAFKRSLVNIKFIGKDVDKVVQGAVGESLLHVAEKNGIKIPCACEGSCACGTCHVYVTKGMDLLNEISDKENDTLDFAVDVHDDSRLSCTARIVAEDGEIEAKIPMHSRNVI
ncbi:ISC system 2Fe-2S type ferredoxin [Histomonas meleagridis]|uniref:ISC system 2Fe-2S type ferredoxin n=1 Tax=Histomonas meleagridis TaxID=135588 RepID=UPI00355A1545|nr:ISC system 2Fe-2S type ferredoxin [Histomonas meleagridis]KAH0801817.1 ISC system 2Fe-2S type ferredoxin [Histomonas meleagridis]